MATRDVFVATAWGGGGGIAGIFWVETRVTATVHSAQGNPLQQRVLLVPRMETLKETHP